MEQLGINAGNNVTIELFMPSDGTYVKIRPHSTDFINLSDPKSVLEKVLSENNIKCFSVSSVKKGVEELEKYNDHYVKIIFGSHYIAEEVYNATGKHFDTTNN